MKSAVVLLLVAWVAVMAEAEESCDCWWSSDELGASDRQCRCIDDVLPTLRPPPHVLTLSSPSTRFLRKESLQPYKGALRDIFLTDMHQLSEIEVGTFSHMRHLRTIYISEAPEMLRLSYGLLRDIPASFRSLRVVRTGLEQVPELSGLGHSSMVHMVDLESNKLRDLESNSIHVQTAQLILNYNEIEAVHGWAFNGSKIGTLSLKGNRNLRYLSEDAFSGLHSLSDLDLSQTAIGWLPTNGLQDLHVLRLEEAPNLTTIPSVYSFQHLREAWLTYSFHCCAFKFPARHDPLKHKMYMEMMRANCGADFDDTGQKNRVRREVDLDYDGGDGDEDSGSGSWNWDWQAEDPVAGFPKDGDLHPGQGGQGGQGDQKESAKGAHDEYRGAFSQTTAIIPISPIHATCGNLSRRSEVMCRPEPDALNPCEDIMGLPWLRTSVWLVLVTALLGNVAVLLVLLGSAADLTVPKFLMCHLALADLCMGLYLLTVASMDLRSSGVYFNYAYTWQMGSGCKVAGFLTMFASQLSVFTLSVVTMERWFAITYAIYLNKRLSLGAAARIMAAGWLYAITMATLPLLGVSNYSSTSICLPMAARRAADISYLVVLLAGNGLAFLLVAVCYAQIYLSLGKDTRHAAPRAGELTVANKMALLVFTDFACWAPIAFFGLTAVAGYPLIDVTRSKILLVFFYPLNSCANPYLYAILTAQYRRDLFILLARYGVCTRVAQQYKMAYSQPTSNNSNPIPLMVRGIDTAVTLTHTGTATTAAAYV